MNGDPPPPTTPPTCGHTHRPVITSLSHFLFDSSPQETGLQDFLWMHAETLRIRWEEQLQKLLFGVIFKHVSLFICTFLVSFWL